MVVAVGPVVAAAVVRLVAVVVLAQIVDVVFVAQCPAQGQAHLGEGVRVVVVVVVMLIPILFCTIWRANGADWRHAFRRMHGPTEVTAGDVFFRAWPSGN